MKYLNKMEDIMNKYREKKDEANYPDAIKYNENAQAFYGVVSEVVCESEDEYDVQNNIEALQKEMMEAAQNLQFERAAQLRDKIKELEERIKN